MFIVDSLAKLEPLDGMLVLSGRIHLVQHLLSNVNTLALHGARE